VQSSLDYILASPTQRALSDAIELAAASAVDAALQVVQNDQQARQELSGAQQPPQGYLTLDQAADRLGLSRKTVLRLVKAGKLPAVNVGTGNRPNYRIDPVTLAEFQSAPTGRQVVTAQASASAASNVPQRRRRSAGTATQPASYLPAV
jgi:excisionase family DNA binding protein